MLSYLVDVLALELGDELVEALGVSLNANGLEDLLDIGGLGGIVAAKLEQENSCEVLHFECLVCFNGFDMSDKRRFAAEVVAPVATDGRMRGGRGRDGVGGEAEAVRASGRRLQHGVNLQFC